MGLRKLSLALLLAAATSTAHSGQVVSNVIAYWFIAAAASGEASGTVDGTPQGVISIAPAAITALTMAIAGNRDPWLNTRIQYTNESTATEYFSFDIWLETDDTAGPTTVDTFMDLTLTDANDDGVALVTNAYGAFSAIDDHGNATAPNVSLYGPNPFSAYVGEGTYSVFDSGGPVAGPDSDQLAQPSPGFNYLRFLTSGYLSPGDTIDISAYACYANDFDSCPDRFVIPVSAVPVPAAAWLFGSALLGLTLLRRKGSAHSIQP